MLVSWMSLALACRLEQRYPSQLMNPCAFGSQSAVRRGLGRRDALVSSLLCVTCWISNVAMENPSKRARTKSEREDEDAIPKAGPCAGAWLCA